MDNTEYETILYFLLYHVRITLINRTCAHIHIYINMWTCTHARMNTQVHVPAWPPLCHLSGSLTAAQSL